MLFREKPYSEFQHLSKCAAVLSLRGELGWFKSI